MRQKEAQNTAGPVIDLSTMAGYQLIVPRKKHNELKDLNFANLDDPRVAEIKTNLRDRVDALWPDLNKFKNCEFVPSGTDANRLAVELAGENEVIICSSLTHVSILEALKKRVGKRIIILHPDESHTVSTEVIGNALVINPHALVCVTYGPTLGIANSGTKTDIVLPDTLPDGIKLHLDATYGGFNIGILEPDKFQGLCRPFDSVTIKPAKFVGAHGVAMLYHNYDEGLQQAPYYPAITTAGISTSVPVYPALSALHTMQQLGLEGMQNFAKQVYKVRDAIAEELKNVGLNLMAPLTSPVIPVKADSEEHMHKMVENARQAGYMILPLEYTNQSCTTHGVRLVVAPLQHFLQDPNIAKKIALALSKGEKWVV